MDTSTFNCIKVDIYLEWFLHGSQKIVNGLQMDSHLF